MKKTKNNKNLQIEPENPLEQPQEPAPEEKENLPKPEIKDLNAEIKAKIESILYCIPEGVTIDALANKLNLGMKADVVKILNSLKAEYEIRPGALKLVQDGARWKFSIPNEHTALVLDAALPEFDKSILETLAYIGWRSGSRQCDVVRVRSNKAYKHIQLLIEKGFIESSKSGLSKWLQPTKKFYEYFNVKPNQKLPISKDVEDRLEAAQAAAEEAERLEQEQKAQAAAEKVQANQQQEQKTEAKVQEDDNNDDGEEPADDEPDSGGEPDGEKPEDEEPEDNPDNE